MKSSKFKEVIADSVIEEVCKGSVLRKNEARKLVSNFYMTEEGRLVVFMKKNISTDFYFGYEDYGNDGGKSRSKAEEDSREIMMKERFFSENLKEAFPKYDEIMKRPFVSNVSLRNANVWQISPEDGFSRYSSCERKPLSDKDAEAIRVIYAGERAKYVKRLETYWKRYGSSKLKVVTFIYD